MISLSARCDIILLSLFLGKDIICNIIYLPGAISFRFHYFSAGISLGILLPARWDIIPLSLFLGRDIICNIIYLPGAISWPVFGLPPFLHPLTTPLPNANTAMYPRNARRITE